MSYHYTEQAFYQLDVNEDDIIQWSFRTYNNSFKVEMWSTSYTGWTISIGKTLDNGTDTVSITETIAIRFDNIDNTSGYIAIIININPQDSISGYNIILIISIIALISISKQRFKKKKRSNEDYS